VVADVGVDFHVLDAVHHGAAVHECGSERQRLPHALGEQLLGGGGLLVVGEHLAVEREGHAGAGAVVAVDHPVADEDAGVAVAVVVAVDREDRIVVLGDVGRVLDDVLPELVVGERGEQLGHVVDDDVGHVVHDLVVAAAGGDGGDGDRRVGVGVAGVGDHRLRGVGSLGGSGVGRAGVGRVGGGGRLAGDGLAGGGALGVDLLLVRVGVGDDDMVDHVAVECPVDDAACDEQECCEDTTHPTQDAPAARAWPARAA